MREPHEFEPITFDNQICAICGEFDMAHQQESQPEHWCDKHQSLFSYHVVYGIRHYVCTQCFIEQPVTHQQDSQQCGSCAGNLPNHEEGCFYKLAQESQQPATHPAEAPEGLRAVEAFYKSELAQAKRDLDNMTEAAKFLQAEFARLKRENNKLAQCLELVIDELEDGYPYGIEDVLKDIEKKAEMSDYCENCDEFLGDEDGLMTDDGILLCGECYDSTANDPDKGSK